MGVRHCAGGTDLLPPVVSLGRLLLSPTAKALRWLESNGYLADVVERRITRTLKKDLFGIFDIVAVRDGETIGIQVTSKGNMSARKKKMEADDSDLWHIKLHWKAWVMGFSPGASKASMVPKIIEL